MISRFLSFDSVSVSPKCFVCHWWWGEFQPSLVSLLPCRKSFVSCLSIKSVAEPPSGTSVRTRYDAKNASITSINMDFRKAESRILPLDSHRRSLRASTIKSKEDSWESVGLKSKSNETSLPPPTDTNGTLLTQWSNAVLAHPHHYEIFVHYGPWWLHYVSAKTMMAPSRVHYGNRSIMGF